jgi:hypothetical protein
MAFKVTKTIAVGQSQSDALTTNEMVLAGFVISGSGASATTMTYLVSPDGNIYYPLYDSTGTEVQTTISSSSAIAYSTDVAAFLPWTSVKFRLGTSASPVNQATYPLSISAQLVK